MRRLENALFDLVSRNLGDAGGNIRNLTDIGLRLRDGILEFDESFFDAQLAANPTEVRAFFDDSQAAAAEEIEDILKSFTSAIDGTITTRVSSLGEQNDGLEDQAERLAERLERERIRLENQFIQMEIAIAKVQNLEGTLSQLQQLASFAQNQDSSK